MRHVILNIPIEPIDRRYTAQWQDWFAAGFDAADAEVKHIYGTCSENKSLDKAAFLDTIGTNEYKTSQLMQIIDFLKTYNDLYRVTIFFQDIWFPGIINIAYIRDGLGLKNLRICGCLHSGIYDPTDRLARCGMDKWGTGFEESLFQCVDEVYVATQYHLSNIHRYRDVDDSKFKVIYYPMMPIIVDPENVESMVSESLLGGVVFPHRLVPEKHPEHLARMQGMLDDTVEDKVGSFFPYVRTLDHNFTKDQLYYLMHHSRFVFSAAEHENFGIAVLEGALCGAVPIVPDTVSYRETVLPEFRYKDLRHAAHMMLEFIEEPPVELLTIQQGLILLHGGRAVPTMIESMLTLK